jgi:hypothetical protein
MADNIQISELLESTTAANSDWIAIDNGTATKKISVQNFNATGAASAAQSAAAAAQSASAALASQTAAEQAEDDTQALITSAQTIVSSAQTYANEASTSAGTASTAANTATAQAAIATNQANLAAGYAANVDNFAKTAKSWAVGGTGTRSGEDTDNSKYYSQQAHDSEINAAASETAAAASEANAAASETAAAASESNAATSESNAASSETNAAASESSAATSASNAASSESNAATSETNAAASATAAGESEDDSEAWAWGKIDGVDVPATHPAYHNNAKYWADAASGGVSGVSSFNGRSGVVVPASGDYAANIIEYDPSDNALISTNVQDAIEEVQGNVGSVASDLSTLDSSLKTVAKTGSYNDLTNKPTLGTAAAKNSTSSVTSGSTDLVESGAVYSEISAETTARTNADNVFTTEISDMNNVLGAKNLLPNIGVETSTDNGVTYTKNSDGSVTANGTATGWAYYNLCSRFTLDAGTYILSGKEAKAATQIKITNADTQADVALLLNNDTEKQFTLNTKTTLHAMLYIGVNAGTVTDFVFYPMLRLASIEDDTYVPYSMTNQQMTPYALSQSNPNLLDNPWFTVNQRGQSTYSSTWAYCLDRWYNAVTTSVAVNNDGTITITGSSDNNSLIRQILEPSLVTFLTGKTVTISALLSDGTLIKQTGVFTNVGWAFVHYDTSTISIDLSNAGTSTQFRIRTVDASTITVKAVKLELGSVSTLAQDTAPNYGSELLKCQTSTTDSSDAYANRNISGAALVLEQSQTLSTSADTVYTFTNGAITTSSAIEVYTDIYGINPSNVVATSGQCVVTFPKQSTAQTMTCRIYVK